MPELRSDLKNARWNTVLNTVVPSYILSAILFLMLEVFWADFVRKWVKYLERNGQYTPITTILYIGFLSIFLINLLVTTLISKIHKKANFQFVWKSFLLSFLIVVIFSFCWLNITYPDTFGVLSMTEKFALFFQYPTYIAVYLLPSPVLLWFVFQALTYVIYAILFKITIKERISYSLTKIDIYTENLEDDTFLKTKKLKKNKKNVETNKF